MQDKVCKNSLGPTSPLLVSAIAFLRSQHALEGMRFIELLSPRRKPDFCIAGFHAHVALLVMPYCTPAFWLRTHVPLSLKAIIFGGCPAFLKYIYIYKSSGRL